MPQIDLDPYEYRKKGAFRIRHFDVDRLKRWVTILGVAGAGVIWVGVLYEWQPGWLPYALGLAPGIAVIVMYAALEGGRQRIADPPPSQPSESRLPEAGRARLSEGKAGVSSRGRLPK